MTSKRRQAGPSALEQQLKAIIRDHRDVRLHRHSPSGPHVRTVMWIAEPLLLGQVFWDPDGEQWVVRAFHIPSQDSLVEDHPDSIDDIPAAIDTVLAALRRR